MENVPIKYVHGERKVIGLEFSRPTGGVLADTRRQAEEGDVYSALMGFIAGSVAEVEFDDGASVTDRSGVKAAIRSMPYAVANWAAVRIFLNMGRDGEIDGVWVCPRCKHQFYSDPEFPDMIEDLEVSECEGEAIVDAELRFPVEVKNAKTGEVVVSVLSLRIGFPTLDNCVRALRSVGPADEGRLQFAILADALISVDGEVVDQKWRMQWGRMVFERMDGEDLAGIMAELSRYGMQETLPKTCPKCAKRWEAAVDVSGFFASGLRAN